MAGILSRRRRIVTTHKKYTIKLGELGKLGNGIWASKHENVALSDGRLTRNGRKWRRGQPLPTGAHDDAFCWAGLL